MNSQISIPVSTEQFLTLVDFLREQGSDRDPVEVISEAIEQYLVLAGDDPSTFLHHKFAAPESESRGYTWRYKEIVLFLPSGTEIRMPYKKTYHYAKVEGDEILYNGKSVSPAVLANTITNSSRDAWRDLWIRKPGQDEWLLADSFRRSKYKSDKTIEELGL